MRNMLAAKKSREFNARGKSIPSVDRSRQSSDPYRSLKSQHRFQNLAQGYRVTIVNLSLLST